MKVKQSPDDFRVEEINRLEPGAEGAFALYRLSKSGIGTPEALRVVQREWRIAPSAIDFAGLKDRYGRTGQSVTIKHGPKRNFEGRGWKLNYLGRSPEPARRGTIARNEFRIRLRDLAPREAELVRERALLAGRAGYPDYYDDQRFGSLRGTGGRFVAEALLAGDFEEALRLTVASPAREDRSRAKRRRRALRDGWGDWQKLADGLDRSIERRVCEALAGGSSFQEAYQLLDPGLRSMHLSAYQSRIFNECLRLGAPRGGPRHPGAAGAYRFFEEDPGDLAGESIPLASAEAPEHPWLDAVLTGVGVDRATLERLPFRAGRRDAVVVPTDLQADEPETDDLNRGRLSIILAFSLRPGSYATMLVKRCTYDLR
jgi:tRNA pseudouridine13 synthase